MINNMIIFTTYKSLFQNFIKILPIIYQNKTITPRKSGKLRFSLKGGKMY